MSQETSYYRNVPQKTTVVVIPGELHLALREEALRRELKTGRRVTITGMVRDAVRVYLDPGYPCSKVVKPKTKK